MGRVSSAASTGGAGTFFEQHVGAYWLALLLVRGIPPILLGCSLTEVHFQTERLGWSTDDFLIVARMAPELAGSWRAKSSAPSRLALQTKIAKRQFKTKGTILRVARSFRQPRIGSLS
jgi:hypothetical protein